MPQVDKDIIEVPGVPRGREAKGYVAYWIGAPCLIWTYEETGFSISSGLIIQWGQGLNIGKLLDKFRKGAKEVEALVKKQG